MAIQIWLKRAVCLVAAVSLYLMGMEGQFHGPAPLLAQQRAGGVREIQQERSGESAVSVDNEALVPLRVQRVVLIGNSPAVLLMERGGTRFLLIFIDFFMANAIRSGMIGQRMKRPLTHDLIGILLDRLGGKVKRITITELKDNTYFALISLQVNGRVVEIDARPSDALAIAVRIRAPIYAHKALLRPMPGKDDKRKGTPPPAPKNSKQVKSSVCPPADEMRCRSGAVPVGFRWAATRGQPPAGFGPRLRRLPFFR